jgi:HD-GYP domain-containing protein (c-di-GMP phosphodiesterase class II)
MLGGTSMVSMETLSDSQMHLILSSSRLLNSQLESDRLLSLVLTKAMAVAQAEAGTLWLVMEDKMIKPVIVEGIKKELVEVLSLKEGEGFAGRVIAKNEPIMVEDVQNDPGWASRIDQETGFNTRSILCIPLRARDRVIGCLELVNKIKRVCFSQHDLDLSMIFAGHAAVALDNNRLYLENRKLLESVILVLASTLNAKEPYAREHSERVTSLSLAIGQMLGLSGADLEVLKWTALLHDVGKIGIMDTILFKKDRLSDRDWDEIKKHPQIGYNILIDLKPAYLAEKICSGVLGHHEKFDGSGYPEGLKDVHIPLYSRIIAVADAFDAIISDRPYRNKSSVAEAVEEIRRCTGTQFDPEIVRVFLKTIEDMEID